MADDTVSHIYILRDPRDGSVRYVGKTKRSLKQRLKGHINDARLCHRYRSVSYRDRWIAKLLRNGLAPTIESIEIVHGRDWAAAEMRWIAHFRSLGAKLTNSTDGGEGCTGWKASDKFRATTSARLKALLSDPVEKEKFLGAARAAQSTPEAREALGKRTRASWARPGMREKFAASFTEAWADPEKKAARKAAMAAAWTPERRAALAEKMKIRCATGDKPQLKVGKRTAEHTAVLMAISNAAWADPEKRAARIEKIRAGQIAHQAKKRAAKG